MKLLPNISIFIPILLAFQIPISQAQNTCMDAVVIPAIPFNSGLQTTCGKGDDYGLSELCDLIYGDGQDFVYQLNITNAPVTYSFILGGASNYKIASVHSACPPMLTNCIGSVVTGAGSMGYGNITFPTNGTYYIIIDTWPGPECGEFSLNIFEPLGIAPNDACGAALLLPTVPNCVPIVGTTNGATDNNEIGDCENGAPNLAQNAVWFQFQATNTTHFVTVQGIPGFDAVVGAINACGSNARPTGGNCTDLTGPGEAETLHLTGLTIGQIYFVQVQDLNGGAGPNSLFTICVAEPAANDACINAIDMGNQPISVNSSNATATDEGLIGYASCDGSQEPINDVWFKFTTGEMGGSADVTFSNNTFDGVLAVYSGCSAANDIDCADNFVSMPEVINLSFLPPNTPYYIRVSGYDGESGPFSISVTGPALPLELQSFTGKALAAANELYWITASERNVQWHIIERSPNGTDAWLEIGRIASKGDALSRQNYSLTDLTPLTASFYRLHSVDNDGKSSLSPIVQITRPLREGSVSIYPNPTTAETTLQFNSPAEDNLDILITDISGRAVQHLHSPVIKGLNTIKIDLHQLPQGNYCLFSSIENTINTPIRIVKE